MNTGLFMTGLASGLGKGISQGLEKYQTYLATSQLQDERARLEDRRMERMEGFAQAREERGQAFDLKRDKSRQDFETGMFQTKIGADVVGRAQDQAGRKEIVGMEADSRKDLLKEEQSGKEKLQSTELKARSTEGELNRKSEETIEANRTKASASEKAKDRAADAARIQAETGRAIAIESMRLSQAKHAAGKLDPRIDAEMEFYKKRLDGLNDLAKSGLFSPDDLDKRFKSVKREIDGLLGFEEKARQPYRDPLAK